MYTRCTGVSGVHIGIQVYIYTYLPRVKSCGDWRLFIVQSYDDKAEVII